MPYCWVGVVIWLHRQMFIGCEKANGTKTDMALHLKVQGVHGYNSTSARSYMYVYFEPFTEPSINSVGKRFE